MIIHLHWYHLPASIMVVGLIIAGLIVWSGKDQGSLDQAFTTLFAFIAIAVCSLIAGALVLGHYL